MALWPSYLYNESNTWRDGLLLIAPFGNKYKGNCKGRRQNSGHCISAPYVKYLCWSILVSRTILSQATLQCVCYYGSHLFMGNIFKEYGQNHTDILYARDVLIEYPIFFSPLMSWLRLIIGNTIHLGMWGNIGFSQKHTLSINWHQYLIKIYQFYPSRM